MNSTYLERAFRRIQALFGRGRVTGVDDTGGVQVMQVQMNALEIPDGRVHPMHFGFTSVAPGGSDVLALHVSGDRTAGAVIATNHQPSRPKGLNSGESMLYSQDGKQIYMTASGGIVVEAKGQDVTVNNAATVTINAQNVTVNASGNVQATAKGELTLSAQGPVNINGAGGIQISGSGGSAPTSISSSGPVSITAPSIAMNPPS